MTPDLLLHESESGRTLDLKAGQALSLELRDPGATGYQWKLEPFDASVLVFTGRHTAPSAAVGGAGKATWTFQALAPGTTRLRLKLWREWLGDASVIGRFEALLHVH